MNYQRVLLHSHRTVHSIEAFHGSCTFYHTKPCKHGIEAYFCVLLHRHDAAGDQCSVLTSQFDNKDILSN